MAITDYIPNIFGQAPGTYQGLLGAGLITPEQLQQTQSRANIQGLLGAGLALAQGMSRIGPRRSAAENILAALSGGLAAGGGAFDQSLKNIAMQQQLQSAALTQKQALDRQAAIAEAGRDDPALAQLLLIDPAEGAKQLAFKQQIGASNAKGPVTPQSLRSQADIAYIRGNKPLGDSYMNQADRLEVEMRLRPQPVSQVAPQVEQAPQQAIPSFQAVPGFGVQPFMTGAVEPQAEPTLERINVIERQGPDAQLLQDKITLINANRRLEGIATKKARDTRKANEESIKAIDDQLRQMSTAQFDWATIEKEVPANFKGQVTALKRLSETGYLGMDQIRTGIQDIYRQAQESARGMRLEGLTGTYAQMKYQTMDQTKLTPDQLADVIRFQNAPDAAKTAELAREATKLQAEFGVSAPVPAGRGEFIGRGGVRQQAVAPAPRVAPSAQVAPAPEVAPQAAPQSKFVPKSISDNALINQPPNVLPLVKRQELLQKQPATENLTRYTLRNIVDARDSARALLNNPEYIKSLTTMFSPLSINVPNTNAYTANQLLQNLLTRSFVSELQQMRTASPTGGAVGNVAIAEMEALSKIQGAMKPGMSEAEFKKQLEQYINVSERAMKDLPKEFARTYSYKGEFDDILSGTIVPPSGQKTPVQLELERRKAKKP